MATISYDTTVKEGIWEGPARTLQSLLLCLTLPLFFIPKINLIKFAGQTAGLRVDDLFILCAALLIFCSLLHARQSLLRVEKLMGAFLLLATFSLFWNWFLYSQEQINLLANPLPIVRMVEYFTFFYIGAILAKRGQFLWLIRGVFAVNFVAVVAQSLDLIGGFTATGYTESVQGGPTGLTAGHWEVGFIFNVCYAVLLDAYVRQSSLMSLPLMALNLIATLLTGSRSAALAFVAITLFYFFRGRLWRSCLVVGCVAFAGLLSSDFFWDSTLVKRSEKLFAVANLSHFERLFHRLDVESHSFDETFEKLDPARQKRLDGSWFIRMHKWCYALKSFASYPSAYLIGLGPGSFGVALDGGLLRLLVEYGLMGSWLFLALLWSASVGVPMLYACLVAFLCNSLFLDTFLAYKDMSLYFLIMGANLLSIKHHSHNLPRVS